MTQSTQEAPPVDRMIGADLFTFENGKLFLRISTCANCGATWFPAREQCADCAGTDMANDTASGEGVVYASSVVQIGPRQFDPPYGVAYVDIAGVRVLAHTGVAVPLAPGTPVRFHLAPIAHDDQGPLYSYAVTTSHEGTYL